MHLRRPPLDRFDPDAAGIEDSGIFGLPFSADESSILLFGYPWEATTSYGQGTAFGPEAILRASAQLDLFDLGLSKLGLGSPYRHGIHLRPIDPEIHAWNQKASALAQKRHEAGGSSSASLLQEVNRYSEQINLRVREDISTALEHNRLVGVIGGDHSVPLGAILAYDTVAQRQNEAFGILHIDAHADLRIAYEGFDFSHASIMHNVLERCTNMQSLVQVGIRDLSEAEHQKIEQDSRIHCFFGPQLFAAQQAGQNWASLCQDIVSALPERVYISFDIDGLDPSLCPHTGTPVPGGLSFHDAQSLLLAVVESGRKVIGFDLCEVSPPLNAQGHPRADTPAEEWDANVGARILYRLCGALLHSHGARD